jgi:hypothetical protein
MLQLSYPFDSWQPEWFLEVTTKASLRSNMSAMWIIYLADVVGGLSTLIIFCGIFLLMAIFPLFMFMVEIMDKDAERTTKKIMLLFAAVGIFSVFVGVLIPSKQTIYMMAAAKVGQDIVASPETKEIGGKVLQLINQKLDEQLKGM